jgi:cupin 2 domain-containing protein
MNLFDYTIPEEGEIFQTLLSHKNIKIVRIVSSDQLEEKTYCQEEDEWVILLEGSASLFIEESRIDLSKGESLFIPAGTRHRVLETRKGTLWLAVHISKN